MIMVVVVIIILEVVVVVVSLFPTEYINERETYIYANQQAHYCMIAVLNGGCGWWLWWGGVGGWRSSC